MDFNATIDLIIRELEEAREIMDDLKKFSGAPVLEIELAKSKIKNAGEVISLLKQHKDETLQMTEEVKPGEKYSRDHQQADETAHVKTHDDKKPPSREKSVGKHHAKEETTGVEPVTDAGRTEKEAFEMETEEERKDPGKPDAEHSDKKPFVAPIIADTFSHLANRFNEQVGEKQSDDFSYTHGRHYTNLADAIGVNDRFYYIRELFEGSRDTYNEAVSRLEQAKNIDEAKEIILSYRKDKRDNEASRQLLRLIKRKFASNE